MATTRGSSHWAPLMVAPRETWRGLRCLDGHLALLLEHLVHESRGAFPQLHSLTLYGDIPLGEFTPSFTDINVAAFSRTSLGPENTASALGLWSRLVRDHDDLARRLVLTALPLPSIHPRGKEMPLGVQIRSRWEDGRVLCRAVWRLPFNELDLVSLTWQGRCLLGHPPREFLHPPTLRDALIHQGRREIEGLFTGRGRRLFLRAFRRAHRPGVRKRMSRIDESRYVRTVLGLTRLLQGLRENRLVARSESGYWFRREFGGIAGRFAYDVASYRLRPGAYPDGYLAHRATFFPEFARVVLEEVGPQLYQKNLRVSSAAHAASFLVEWDHLSETIARQIFA